MASFWKKITKTFLTLLLLVGVFFAGFAGLAPIHKANAEFADTKIESEGLYRDSAIFLTYAEDVLVGVDENGYIYRATDGTANLVKTGVQIGAIAVGWANDSNYMLKDASGKYIAYQSGTLVVPSYDTESEITTIYYSTDLGETWLSNNIGDIGAPMSIITGGSKFVVITYDYVGSISGYTKIYSSADGKTWIQECEFIGHKDLPASGNYSHYPDQLFKYNSGYFIKTTTFNLNVVETGVNNIFVQVSTNLQNWISIPAPYQATVNDFNGNSDPYISTTAFMIDNVLYCLQRTHSSTNTWSRLYKTTTIVENATWQLVSEDCDYFTNIEPYMNGVIACYYNETNKSGVKYFEVDNTGIINTKSLISDPNPYDFTGSYPEVEDADTIAIGKRYLCVGFSGQAYQSLFPNQELKNALFTTYKRSLVYNVKFVDWNGNIITQSQVPDGGTVIAPANPTREGYNFVGWDYDLTQPITDDLVITAQYEIKTYTITFLDWNGQLISSVTKEYSSVLVSEDIPTPVRDGYSFSGWDSDIGQAITTDLTFIAQYSRDLTLTINYLEPYGTAGYVNQFSDMRPATKVFNYTYGDTLATEELESWYNATIIPWVTDYEADGLYDYTYKLTGWDCELPTTITNNLIINATYEELNTVTLIYYSQLRFLAYEEDDGTDYYYTFIGYMIVDKLMADGEVIDVEDFKNPNVNYNIYNASKNTFYNNLEYFEFLGWDKDITAPITEDTTIKAQYKLPTIQTRLFDSDNYFIGTMEQDLSFMTIEDLQALDTSSSKWDKWREGFRLFFSLQWGEIGNLIADKVDLDKYLDGVRRFHTPDCQILTAFVCVNTDYPEYGGIFKNGLVATSSPVLEYYTGTAKENNMSFWINPIVFATRIYPLTCTVTYSNALGSIVKTVNEVLDTTWGVVSEYWWIILIVVLLIIFRKPLIAALTMLFGAIKKGAQKLRAKVKSKSKNSEYKKTEKEYTAVKKESKKKEK